MNTNILHKKIIVSIIILNSLIIVLISSSHFFSNLWGIIKDENYFIPHESNIFIFNATQMNYGSGDWWIYGEDNFYYYALNDEPDYLPKYFKLQKGKEPKAFNKFDYKTWLIKLKF